MIEIFDNRPKYEPTYLATVRSEDSEIRLTKEELEHSVRSGEISPDSFVHYLPWTGDDFLPLWKISQLKNLCLSSDALMIDHLRTETFPWLSTTIFVLFFVAGLLQFRDLFAVDVIKTTSLGWSNSILLGRWWTVWLYPFVHVSSTHWLGNIVVAYYCSFRVERIFGALGLWMGITASLLVGALLVLIGGEELVVGDSVLVFGLWVMQVTIGFRLADSLPKEHRGKYGWGNLFVFLPLLIINFMSKDVSHLAHLGGIFAGGLLGFFYQPATSFPQRQRKIIVRKGLITAGFFHFLMLILCLVVSKNPLLSLFPTSEIRVEEDGIALLMSDKLQREESEELNIWQTTGGQFSVFESSFWLRTNEELVADPRPILASWWRKKKNYQLQAVKEIPFQSPEREGWHNQLLESTDFWIWEHFFQEGRFLLRTGCILPKNNLIAWEHCKAILEQITRFDNLELREAKTNFLQYSLSAKHGLYYGELLRDYGRYHEMEAVYEKISRREDSAQWPAFYQRLLLRKEKPQQFSNWEKDRIWMEHIQKAIPITEEQVMVLALEYALQQKQCDWVEEMLDRWSMIGAEFSAGMIQIQNQCTESY